MRKLLSANFSRLWKDRFFWALLLFLAVGSVLFGLMTFRTAVGTEETTYYVEDLLFNLLPMLGFVLAFFISLRVGTEFDNHTIRNKLIVGHSRTQVYFGEYLVCLAASLLLLVVTLLFSGGTGYVLFRAFALDGKTVAEMVCCSVLLTAVFSALFVGLSMSIHNKALSVVGNLVFLFALFFLASFVGSALNEAEMTYEYVRITAENGLEFGPEIRNPAYVEGIQRTIYEFIYDALPTGQAGQLNDLTCDRMARWPLLSLLMLVLSTAAGYLGFRKRDIN